MDNTTALTMDLENKKANINFSADAILEVIAGLVLPEIEKGTQSVILHKSSLLKEINYLKVSLNNEFLLKKLQEKFKSIGIEFRYSSHDELYLNFYPAEEYGN